MNKKTLILMDDMYEMYGLNGKEEDDICFLPLLKRSGDDVNKLYRLLRKIHFKLALPFEAIWLERWTKVLEKYDTIIIGETSNSNYMAKFVHHYYPQKRIIIWYRNSVSKSSLSPDDIDRSLSEIWSFDKDDCRKYSMRYNGQFYMKSPYYKENGGVEYDAFFIGRDKGRLEEILDVKDRLDKLGLKTVFKIVGYNSKPISYKECLDYISKSRIIVDIQGGWQQGMTLRPMESLFYQKKLITNNKDLQTMDFYNSNNIFILGKDNVDNLGIFCQTKHYEIQDSIIAKYGLKQWVNNFGV